MRASLAALLVLVVAFASPRTAQAEPGDTTWVNTWNQDFINWASNHDSTFTFPDASVGWEKVLLYYTIGCPQAPGDCDPWDRIGYLRLQDPSANWIEIARVITPYDITGGSRPGTCTWVLDVSDYMHLLQGEVPLRNYIESWIGGNRGWLVTIDFAFIEGTPEYRPYQVMNLWNNYYTVYGDQTRPIEDVLAPLDVAIDADADAVKLRVITTGHGQGNTGNCAEFCPKQHSLFAGSGSWARTIWKSDCATNTCSPQGGTWTLNRAGWCPGQEVQPWDVDITDAVVPGEMATVNYDVQAYTNFCCPCNPSCVSGSTCADCNYNSTGHTEPIYAIQSQLIFYEAIPLTGVAESGRESLRLQNDPNPFRPATTIAYELPAAGDARLVIYDAGGRQVRHLFEQAQAAGPHRVAWDGRSDQGDRLPAGVYFYELRFDHEIHAHKMLMLD